MQPQRHIAFQCFLYGFWMPWAFLWAAIVRLLGLKGLARRWYYAGDALLFRPSIHLKKAGPLFGLKMLVTLLRQSWKERHQTHFSDQSLPGVAIYDGSDRAIEMRVEYVSRFAGYAGTFPELKLGKRFAGSVLSQTNKSPAPPDQDKLIGTLIPHNRLVFGFDAWHSLSASFMLLMVSPLVLLSLLPPLRAKAVSWMQDIVHAYNLLLTCRRYGIRDVYYLCIFEKESNWLALLLMAVGIRVRKFTSETPMVFYNQCVIADELITCTPYQKVEIQAFAATLFVRDFSEWVPEQTFTFLDHYTGELPDPPANRIALYTSGGWRRKERGDPDLGHGYYESEDLLLATMAEYLSENAAVEVLIFGHPVEKDTPARWKQAQEVYRAILAPDGNADVLNRLHFADRELVTSHCFHHAEVAVTVFSSVMWDRILCGYKSVFAPLEIDIWPLRDFATDSDVGYAVASTPDQLKAALTAQLAASSPTTPGA